MTKVSGNAKNIPYRATPKPAKPSPINKPSRQKTSLASTPKNKTKNSETQQVIVAQQAQIIGASVPKILTEASILKVLDNSMLSKGKPTFFPILDNYNYWPVNIKMHVYGDANRWLITFDKLDYNYSNDLISRSLISFGPTTASCKTTYKDVSKKIVAEKMLAAKINHPKLTQKNILTQLRKISDNHPEVMSNLMSSATELNAHNKFQLPKLLELHEWVHTDIDEKPSKNPTFQNIAKVICTQDADQYTPPAAPNTHWSNWTGSENDFMALIAS